MQKRRNLWKLLQFKFVIRFVAIQNIWMAVESVAGSTTQILNLLPPVLPELSVMYFPASNAYSAHRFVTTH